MICGIVFYCSDAQEKSGKKRKPVCYLHVQFAGFNYKWEKDEWDDIVGFKKFRFFIFVFIQASSLEQKDWTINDVTMEIKDQVVERISPQAIVDKKGMNFVES